MSKQVDPARTAPEQEGQVLPRPEQAPAGEHPSCIGRYRVERLLGEGGFGRVYMAHDDQLQRRVAVKVPHRRLVACPEDAAGYLAEARTAAGLDHPHIVSVFDAGSTADYPCFIVSKFIEGCTLAQRLRDGRPSAAEAAALVAAVAEALHHAHHRGIVHRDVKPGNILLDTGGRPHVTDFGLALKEEEVGRGPRYAGTPTYMSPEQARGEGHRVDGRSDVFSLGVVFYELLTGRQPFRAESRDELLEQIATAEPRAPRQIDDTLPRELERICLKALAKRASERYTTAADLAEDLRRLLDQWGPATAPRVPAGAAVTGPAAPTPLPLRIVPKGLRAFDAHDADFFLELLPGPRDREGLPDGIRFWKTRIEETDPDNTFAVGLLYGPSGCGKSSLVKAGLLPRLAKHIVAVYVEATADDTETRILRGLRKHCPDLSTGLGLVEAVAVLRRGQRLPAAHKVLLVLDQFEQWLHAGRGEQNSELVQALRQCDGGRVQCLVMVRDDFWLAVSRFMADLEADLLQGRNMALVDLFDPRHAKKVLAALGRAFGALPPRTEALTHEQEAFLDQAVGGLAQDGKIVSVRLALFAEMVKGRPWTPATLKAIGGMKGVGVTFLEESFAATTASPQHRVQQRAAQAVLHALLPESGTDIKGSMRSRQELLAAAAYAARPSAFDTLLRILDGELRLITPTDSEGMDAASELAPAGSGDRYYQLTHDYLVPSLRDWLTRKQKETRRGRAGLRLAERAALWSGRPENRHLPAWWEWLNIPLLTRWQDWTAPQRRMMRQAARYHGARLLAAVLFLAAAAIAGLSVYNRVAGEKRANHAADLVAHLGDAEVSQVPAIVKELSPYRPWANPWLQAVLQDPRASSKRRLHASLALLPVDPGQVDYLRDRFIEPDTSPAELLVIREALGPYGEQLRDGLWQLVANTGANSARRFRAACALALFDPDSPHWEQAAPDVAGSLVAQNAAFLGQWLEVLKPVGPRLLLALAGLFNRGEPQQRAIAADVLADYAGDQPVVLAGLLVDADERQWAVLWPKLAVHREQAIALMQRELQQEMPPEDQWEARDRLARRQAQAAVALLRLGQVDPVWPLFQHSPEHYPDPSRRTYLLHRLGPLDADVRVVIRRLAEEPDVSARRALILALGEFTEEQLSSEARQLLLAKLLPWYRDDPDPGTHAAIDWLLRHGEEGDAPRKLNWHQAEALARIDGALALLRHKVQLGGLLAAADAGPLHLLPALHLGPEAGGRAARAADAQPGWYVNGQGRTMVVLPGPVEFRMGSPPYEPNRVPPFEAQRLRKISRSYAIAARTVTVAEFQRFLEANPEVKKRFGASAEAVEFLRAYSPAADGPIIAVDWYMAAAYCNWLSRQEGIPEDQLCYPPAEQLEKSRDGQTPLKLPAEYLERTGYRLPTEAEWEYACRAQALTSRYYGASDEMLARYAWYMQNAHDRTRPVGQKKPNDFGLFDMHGNVWNWCQEPVRRQQTGTAGKPADDQEATRDNIDPLQLSLRGGSFVDLALNVRSASRVDTYRPQTRNFNVGLRVVRTCP